MAKLAHLELYEMTAEFRRGGRLENCRDDAAPSNDEFSFSSHLARWVWELTDKVLSALGVAGDPIDRGSLWDIFKQFILAKMDLLQADQYFAVTWVSAGTAFDADTMVDDDPESICTTSGTVGFCLTPIVHAYTPKSGDASVPFRTSYCNFGPAPDASLYPDKSVFVKAKVSLQ